MTRIWWCQEHDSVADEGFDQCQMGIADRELTPCRMVPMRLIPDNAETLEAYEENEWLLIQKVGGEWSDQLIHDLDLAWRLGWKDADFETAEWEEARQRIIAVLDDLYRRSAALDGETP